MRKVDQKINNVENLLIKEEFIKWRLFRTDEMDKYWERFLTEHPDKKETIENAISRFEAVQINRYFTSETDKSDIYQSVLRAISKHERRRKLRIIYPVAAVFIAGIVSLLYVILFKGSDHHPFVENDGIIVGQALPQEEVYLLSAGERISLSNHARIDLVGEGKAVVTDSNDQKELLLAKTSLNQLVVPYGKRSNLTLSDGTEVWLNSGTRLDFPTRFTGQSRSIRVDGEIFIKVSHAPHVPFIVHVQGAEIQVQGTSFNISAYTDEASKTVVLVDGKVTIKTDDNRTAEMLPNEKVNISMGRLSKEAVDVSEYISWKKGVLEFNGTPMSEILKKVGRYYNVQFEETPGVELNARTFSGKLFLSNNLDSVMTSVSILSSTKYSRDENLIRISKK